MVVGSKVDILSLIILSILIIPTLNLFCKSSDNVLSLLFAKWSTWSAFASGLLFNLIISFTTSTISVNFKILSSFEISLSTPAGVGFLVGAKFGSLCHVFHLPTFDKSYLSKLKNILKIKSWAVSGVTKSPGLNLL